MLTFSNVVRCNMELGDGATVVLRRGNFGGDFENFNRGEEDERPAV